MAMTAMPDEVLNFDADLKPYFEEQREQGSVPEVHFPADDKEEDSKLTLVWRTGAGVAIRAMDLHYEVSEVAQSDVVDALKDVFGELKEPEE